MTEYRTRTASQPRRRHQDVASTVHAYLAYLLLLPKYLPEELINLWISREEGPPRQHLSKYTA